MDLRIMQYKNATTVSNHLIRFEMEPEEWEIVKASPEWEALLVLTGFMGDWKGRQLKTASVELWQNGTIIQRDASESV